MTGAGADPLFELRLEIKACTGCHLRHTSKQRVPGDGSRAAPIMLIGEAPGYYEDRDGRAFIGKAGQKLDAWLDLVGLDRHKHLFITNVLRCRPPNNRFPEYERGGPVDSCMPWLVRQLELVNPWAVILAGKRALHHVLLDGSVEMADPFRPWVGRVCRRRDLYGEVRFYPIWHPAYILRNRNPYEEEKCTEALTAAFDYVAAKQGGGGAPVEDLYEVRPVGFVQHQQRFRLFGAPKPIQEPEQETGAGA